MSRGVRRRLQQLRPELAVEEFVGVALVDEQRQLLPRALHQLDGVELFPRFPVVAEVGAEGLLTPRNLRRPDDRRERRPAALPHRGRSDGGRGRQTWSDESKIEWSLCQKKNNNDIN